MFQLIKQQSLLLLVKAFLLSIALTLPAQAQFQIFPHRVVFEPGMRSAEVVLQNSGTATATFRMGWNDIVYDEDLQARQIENDERLRKTPAASSMIRFAPRQVELAPGQTQAIRIRLRRPSGLAAGEYRSHFLFQEQSSAPRVATPSTRAGAQMALQIGITIPLVVRAGSGEADLSIDSAEIQQPSEQFPSGLLLARLKRNGDYGLFLDTELSYQSPEGKVVLAYNTGRGIYTDTERYNLRLSLRETPPRGTPLMLRLSYTQRDGSTATLEESLVMP